MTIRKICLVLWKDSLSLLLFGILLCKSLESQAQAPPYAWVTPHSQHPVGIIALAVDVMGNCFITGQFGGTQDFDGQILTASGAAQDLYLAKYNPNGQLVWVRQAGGINVGIQPFGIAVDPTGNAYVCGHLGALDGGGRISIGNLVVTLTGPQDGRAFVAKYDADGNALWVSTQAQANDFSNCDIAYSIQLDPLGHIYVCGRADCIGEGAYVVKCDPGGNRLWSVTLAQSSETNSASANSVALDAAGNAYVLGRTDLSGMFLAKADNLGRVVWVRQAAVDSTFYGAWVATDERGNCYVAGSFGGYTNTIWFGDQSVTSRGGVDIFLAKYDSNGSLQWVRDAGGTAFDGCHGLVVDPQGRSYLTGNFGSIPADFGGTDAVPVGMNDIFLACYGPNGSLEWLKTAGGELADTAEAIALNGSGELCFAGGIGRFQNTAGGAPATFDSLVLQSPSYLAKLTLPTGSPRLSLSMNAGQVRLSWSTNYTGFVLESTPQLPAISWSAVSAPIVVDGDNFVVTIETSDPGPFYYRLRRP